MDERRSQPRWQINQNAELTVEDGVKPMHCVVEDISPSGMCISMNRNLFNETFADFNLVLDENFEFNVNAHVAWRDAAYEKNIYGLSFDRIDESVRTRISEYVKNNFPDVLVKQWWKGL
jgi:hypothetical protein